MLAQMNLLLHGLESPQVDPGNSLRQRLSEIGDRDKKRLTDWPRWKYCLSKLER